MPTKRDALLYLIFTDKEGPVRSVKVKDNFACNDYEMVDFSILKAGRRVKREITSPDFRRADFGESHFQLQTVLASSPSKLFICYLWLAPKHQSTYPHMQIRYKDKGGTSVFRRVINCPF